MASAGEAVIIGFNTKPVGKAGPIADAENVPIYPSRSSTTPSTR
jgi:hypothetical protein